MIEEKKPQKRNFLHKIFGTTPGDGEMQPGEAIAFSIAGFGQNLVCSIVSSYLPVFMTDAIGSPALWVALLMLFARLLDAFNNPIMGSIVDRTRTRWGKCRPYLRWMPIPIAVMTILCFLPPYGKADQEVAFALITVVYFLWTVVYTVCDVPYWGLSTAMTNDTYRRGNLLTIARLVCTVGAGVVTIVAPQLTSNITRSKQETINTYQNLITGISQSGYNTNALSSLGSISEYITTLAESAQMTLQSLYNAVLSLDPDILTGFDLENAITTEQSNVQVNLQWIYFISAIVCGLTSIPLFFIGFAYTVERNQSVSKPPSLLHNAQLVKKNTPLLLVVAAGLLGSARMAFTYTGGFYFAKYVLTDISFLGMKGEGLYTLITFAIIPGGTLASVLVPVLTRTIGKRKTFIYSHLAGGLTLIAAYLVGIFVDRGNYNKPIVLIIALVAVVIVGIPLGLYNILSYALIGDSVEYLEMVTGERAEGICFALQAFVNKIGLAVCAFLSVLGYSIAGITANNPSALDEHGKNVMWATMVLVPALSIFLAAFPLFFYSFNEDEQQKAVAIIKERKANGAYDTETLHLLVDPGINYFLISKTVTSPVDGEEFVDVESM